MNNAVARTAGLLAVAVLPLVMGLSGADFQRPVPLAHGFHLAMGWCAGLVTVSAVIAWFGIRDAPRDHAQSDSTSRVFVHDHGSEAGALVPESGQRVPGIERPAECHYCALTGPPPPNPGARP